MGCYGLSESAGRVTANRRLSALIFADIFSIKSVLSTKNVRISEFNQPCKTVITAGIQNTSHDFNLHELCIFFILSQCWIFIRDTQRTFLWSVRSHRVLLPKHLHREIVLPDVSNCVNCLLLKVKPFSTEWSICWLSAANFVCGDTNLKITL